MGGEGAAVPLIPTGEALNVCLAAVKYPVWATLDLSRLLFTPRADLRDFRADFDEKGDHSHLSLCRRKVFEADLRVLVDLQP